MIKKNKVLVSSPSGDFRSLTSTDSQMLSWPPKPMWKQIANRVCASRDEKIESWPLNIPYDVAGGKTHVKDIPLKCGLLDEIDIQITESPPLKLQQNLLGRVWSAQTVLQAFIKRTVISHHLTNPLADVFFERGLQRARQLDAIFEETGMPVGPLHGFPISLKDAIRLSGTKSTLGLVSCAESKWEADDPVAAMLFKAGAVFYCKTNVPQSLMSGECNNFIFGRTSSALNTTLSAGGSSGGEGSLVALGGSPLGIGSDIAGSIRTPANFNGIFGLCPSPERFPYHGVDCSDGSTVIRTVAGPLSRSVGGLELYSRTILSLEPWESDFSTIRMPWREQEYRLGAGKHRKLCFAFMHHDGVVQPHPPITRGMQELKRALQNSGHQVIDIANFDGKEIWDVSFSMWQATGGEELTEALAKFDEPLIPEAMPPDATKTLTVRQYHALTIKIQALRQKCLEVWQETRERTTTGLPVDAIILPSGGHVAPPHGTMEYFNYEIISNLLEWTCATVPVTTVDPVLDIKPDAKFIPLSEADARNWSKYNEETYKDAKVCLQVMGQRFTEEKVLGILQTINEALGRGEDYMA